MNGNIGAVIVAAGLSSRMGAYKPLIEIGGVTVARRVIDAFSEAGVSPIVVVTGHRRDELESHLSMRGAGDADEGDDRGRTGVGDDAVDDYGTETVRGDRRKGELLFVRNKDYATTSMYDSAKIGLLSIMGRCERVFFCPVDVPLFTAGTVRRLMESDAPVVKPAYKGEEGHPILIDAKLIPAITGLGRTCGATPKTTSGEPRAVEGEGGLRAALAPFKKVTEIISVEDEGVLYDADTPDDIKKLSAILKP
ncbi:MAG: nucleotidyltransferase family protein [Clostridiales Family XIII bacterium]|jgi:CTP:molybdopterin cytidylyltransferase MocA|nr:nucleotidyltransferase family protein [Clostridiales Family XIII bacterium]